MAGLTPVIDLQGDQYANHYQNDLANGIYEISAEFLLTEEALAKLSEETKQGRGCVIGSS